MKRGTIITLAVLAAFAAFLLYGTLGSQKHECYVEVEFHGQRNSATASAATEQEAAQNAQTTACGPIAAGMNDVIACGNVQPVVKRCRTL